MTQQHKEEERTLKDMFGDNNNHSNNTSRPGSSFGPHPHVEIKSSLSHNIINSSRVDPTSSSSVKEAKRKKTARVLEGSTDQSLLPIQLLSEGVEEWNTVIEWCA